MTRTTPTRRASVLLSVFAIVIVAALLAVTILAAARNTAALARSSTDSAETRSLAAAAITALLTDFRDQREALLRGDDPELDDAITLWEQPDGRRAVARILPFARDTTDPMPALPENARLDANHASAEALAALERIDDDLAAALVEARGPAPFFRLADLLDIDRIDADALFGPPQQRIAAGASANERAAPSAATYDTTAPDRLADVLTVFSFEPNVAAGLAGPNAAPGTRRINLNAPSTGDIRNALAQTLGEQAADALVTRFERGDITLNSRSDLVNALMLINADIEDWPSALDRFTVTDAAFIPNRININHAAPAVLATLPGIDDGTARAITDQRDELAADQRRSPAWLVTQGAVSPQQFAQLSPFVTARSLQWRLRIEVGVERSTGEAPSSSPFAPNQPAARAGDLTAVTLEHRRLYELVIDASAPSPRVAHLEDITHLAGALRLHALAADDDNDRPLDLPGLTASPPAEDPNAAPPSLADARLPAATFPNAPGFDRPAFDRPTFDRPTFSDRPIFDAPTFERPAFDPPTFDPADMPEAERAEATPFDRPAFDPAEFSTSPNATAATPADTAQNPTESAASARDGPPLEPRLGRWTAPAR